jgi:hypothetical protein
VIMYRSGDQGGYLVNDSQSHTVYFIVPRATGASMGTWESYYSATLVDLLDSHPRIRATLGESLHTCAHAQWMLQRFAGGTVLRLPLPGSCTATRASNQQFILYSDGSWKPLQEEIPGVPMTSMLTSN